MITVYITPTCPRCEALKHDLTARGHDFQTVNMGTPEALTELRCGGCYTMAAPVLQIEDRFFTVEELFDGERLRKEVLDEVLFL